VRAPRDYLDRTVDPPRVPADNALIERLRQAQGERRAQVFADSGADSEAGPGVDPNRVLAHETHIEPNHFNDNDPEWLYELTTPLHEAYRAGDAEGVQALLARGALATRFITLHDGSTASFKHTYVAYKLPADAWTYRELLYPVPASDPCAPAARLLERALQRELEAAARGALPPEDLERGLVCGLFLAIERGDRAAIDRWLAAGADPMLGGPGGVTAVGLALRLRDHRTVKKLIPGAGAGAGAGATLEAICAWNLPQLSSSWTLYPVRPLHCAAAYGDKAMLRYLLDLGADPTQGFPKSYPLLVHFFATEQSRPDRGCLQVLAGPTVRRLRETRGEAAMMEGLSDYWSRDVLASLEGAGLVPRAR
jgi:ankyrin repeat protein